MCVRDVFILQHIQYIKERIQKMYGRLHERKINERDFLMSCEAARHELDEYIDQESRRVNVDSAKKLAVLQHFDYEGFRQMVLGANIFPTKSSELTSFTKGEGGVSLLGGGSFNKEALQPKTQSQFNSMEAIKRRVEGKSQLQCNTFREFRTKFMKHYQQNLTFEQSKILYTLLQHQSFQNLTRIFSLPCQALILPKIIQVFTEILSNLAVQNVGVLLRQATFMIKFIEVVVSIQSFKQINIKILGKTQRSKINDFLVECKKMIAGSQGSESSDAQSIDKIISVIQKK